MVDFCRFPIAFTYSEKLSQNRQAAYKYLGNALFLESALITLMAITQVALEAFKYSPHLIGPVGLITITVFSLVTPLVGDMLDLRPRIWASFDRSVAPKS